MCIHNSFPSWCVRFCVMLRRDAQCARAPGGLFSCNTNRVVQACGGESVCVSPVHASQHKHVGVAAQVSQALDVRRCVYE